MRAVDVVLGELEAVAEGVVDVGLSGEVHDGVDAFGDEEVVDQVGAGDVAFHELEAGGVFRRVKVLEVGAVVELVEDHDLVVRVGSDEPVRHVGGDETGGSGDENVLGRVRSHLDNNNNNNNKETDFHALLQYKNETLDVRSRSN